MNEAPVSREAPSLVDYARRAWKLRNKVAISAVTGGVFFFLISYLIPPSYQAVTTLIPAPSQEGGSILSQLGANLADLGLHATSKADYSPMYSEIVRSRRLLDEVLQRSYSRNREGRAVPFIDVVQPRGFGLRRNELAFRRLRRSIDARLDNRTGVLTIRARAPEPDMAAAVANTLDSLLQEFTIHSLATQAAQTRIFVEGRLSETVSGLANAENELKTFRERNLRIGNSPRLQLEEGRLARALREQEEIYLTLRRQYELARIEEHRDVPVVNVLDSAIEPAFRESPRRLPMALLGMFVGAIGFLAYTIARDL